MQLPLTKLPIHVYIFINQQSIFNKYLSQIIYPRYIFINLFLTNIYRHVTIIPLNRKIPKEKEKRKIRKKIKNIYRIPKHQSHPPHLATS